MKIQVYKCRFTGEIFGMDQRNEYAKHLLDLRRDLRKQRQDKKKADDFQNWLAKEKDKIVSVDMIVPWILENQYKLMTAYNALNWRAKMVSSKNGERWNIKNDKIKDISLDVRYSNRVPNTHRCPANGVTNWGGRDKNKPTGYPGYRGQISGCTIRKDEHMWSYPTADLLEFIGIHTGSGGGGNKDWSFGVEIFLDDWPGLAQEIMVDKLKGNK